MLKLENGSYPSSNILPFLFFFFDFLKSSPKFDFENFPSILIVYLSLLDKGEISFSVRINKLNLLHEAERRSAKYFADLFRTAENSANLYLLLNGEPSLSLSL